jgi:hypothetical protein
MNALKNKLGLALIALLGLNNLTAQEATENRISKTSGGFGYFGFTGKRVNIGELNSFLASQDYGKVKPEQLTWGGGGNFAIRNVLVGGEGAGFFTSQTSNNYNTLTFTGGYGYFNTGYILCCKKRYTLYALAGIGGGGYSMIINNKNMNTSFHDQVNSPSGAVTIESGGLLFNAQLCYQYFFCGKNTEGFFAGLKAGYHYSPSNWKMSVNNIQLSEAPGINMNGAFVTLILGGGSLIKNK